MRGTRVIFIIATAVSLVTQSAQLWSKDINIAYSTIGANNTVVWVARDMGFFKRHGLDAQVLYVQGGGILIQGMLNGNIPISITSGSQAIVSNLAGTDLVLFSTFH